MGKGGRPASDYESEVGESSSFHLQNTAPWGDPGLMAVTQLSVSHFPLPYKLYSPVWVKEACLFPCFPVPEASLSVLLSHERIVTHIYHLPFIYRNSSKVVYGQQPTRLLHPRDSLGKDIGVGCHFLLQGVLHKHTVHA